MRASAARTVQQACAFELWHLSGGCPTSPYVIFVIPVEGAVSDETCDHRNGVAPRGFPVRIPIGVGVFNEGALELLQRSFQPRYLGCTSQSEHHRAKSTRHETTEQRHHVPIQCTAVQYSSYAEQVGTYRQLVNNKRRTAQQVPSAPLNNKNFTHLIFSYASSNVSFTWN